MFLRSLGYKRFAAVCAGFRKTATKLLGNDGVSVFERPAGWIPEIVVKRNVGTGTAEYVLLSIFSYKIITHFSFRYHFSLNHNSGFLFLHELSDLH